MRYAAVAVCASMLLTGCGGGSASPGFVPPPQVETPVHFLSSHRPKLHPVSRLSYLPRPSGKAHLHPSGWRDIPKRFSVASVSVNAGQKTKRAYILEPSTIPIFRLGTSATPYTIQFSPADPTPRDIAVSPAGDLY